jgi:GT2 family glycosyltransferase
MNATVVIATRNRRDSLLHTLGLLEALPERATVMVVDNDSTDGSADAVRRRYPAVITIQAGTNLGAAARNLGAHYARTPYVAFCDDDSWWAPGSLARAVELLDRHPGLGLVAARVLVEPSGHPDPTCSLMANSALPPDPSLPGPRVLGFIACGAVVRRSAFLACGGFDSRFVVGGEEELLAVDLAARGWSAAYVDDVVANHWPAARDRGERTRIVLRNSLLTTWLRRPLPHALRRTASLLTEAGPGGMLALPAAVRRLPWVARERRVVPPEVEGALRLLERR